jgi:tetratricopeptide (TPR) repeat protein
MNISEMWNHQDPAGTEARFRAALENATGDTALILQTQIARTYGIRKQFNEARAMLEKIQPQLTNAGVEAKVHHFIEWGRTFCSATHDQASQTEQARTQARGAFTVAFELARKAKLDVLAIDALHMMAFVDTKPEELLAWNLKTLAFMEASNDPEARKWEGSLHQNVGYGLHQVGRFEEALQHFEFARTAREQRNDTQGARIARWMTAWTFRSLKHFDQAIAIHLQLEREFEADGEPDPYVFEELVLLYQAVGDAEKVLEYQAKQLVRS